MASKSTPCFVEVWRFFFQVVQRPTRLLSGGCIRASPNPLLGEKVMAAAAMAVASTVDVGSSDLAAHHVPVPCSDGKMMRLSNCVAFDARCATWYHTERRGAMVQDSASPCAGSCVAERNHTAEARRPRLRIANLRLVHRIQNGSVSISITISNFQFRRHGARQPKRTHPKRHPTHHNMGDKVISFQEGWAMIENRGFKPLLAVLNEGGDYRR